MLYDFLPDAAISKYCRDITGNMNAACGRLDSNTDLTFGGHGKYQTAGYVYEQFGLPFPAYNGAFDVSGPGAGCFTGQKCSVSQKVCSTTAPVITCGATEGTCSLAPTCSGGIDPGALPGLERYPAGNSPLAGKVYEYWTLWPAPVHNTELNHSYYNPRLTYDPPIRRSTPPPTRCCRRGRRRRIRNISIRTTTFCGATRGVLCGRNTGQSRRRPARIRHQPTLPRPVRALSHRPAVAARHRAAPA